MHRPKVFTPAPVRILKMGTIAETNEEDDYDKIMSSRQSEVSKSKHLGFSGVIR
jgi:hypothetical protein